MRVGEGKEKEGALFAEEAVSRGVKDFGGGVAVDAPPKNVFALGGAVGRRADMGGFVDIGRAGAKGAAVKRADGA